MTIKVAVVGASGVVGRALLDACSTTGVDAVGLSRRASDLPASKHVPLDLMDQDQCRHVARGELADATHLVYTALFEKPGLIAGWREQDQMQTNLTMLRNLIEPLVEAPNQLRNITLLQGTKAYAAHIKPMRIPGREREPRVEHENFYWLQEDYLKARQQGQHWSTTIWRPQIIFGHALGAPMNMLAALGVYAAICQHRNEPFCFPGGPSGVMEAIDADLLAAAILHSFDNADFANETFNITNGDVYRWHDLWPAIAEAVGVSPGEPQPKLLSQSCYNEDEWQQIVKRHGLRPHSVRDLVGDSFFYADALFNLGGDSTPPPAIVSTIKLRQAGFHDCIDTEDMLYKWFNRLRQMRLLP